MKTRNYTLDNAKAFAIFVVVLAHVLRDGRYFTYFVPAAVPVFFLLSGITYHHGSSFLNFILKKIKTIVVPYLFAGVISIIIFAFLGRYASNLLHEDIATTKVLPNILFLLYGSGKSGHMKWNNSLWFLPCLMVIMLLVYLIETIVAKLKKSRFHSLIIRIILSLFCLSIGLYLTRKLNGIALCWHIETALCNVIFTEIGIVIAPSVLSVTIFSDHTCHNAIQRPINRLLTCKAIRAIFFFVLALVFSYLNGETSARTDEYGINFILYFLSAICYAISYLYAGSLIGSKLSAITYTGMNTLPILLWNKYPVIVFQTLIGKFSNILDHPDTPAALIAAVVPAILVIILCLLAGKIQKKFLPVTLGVRPGK